ncbi:hypothetical protein [Xylanimonas ulmi]|uniref:Uncharacterized protein n=1 Tax=Xylanimonas ulmi TaxID=228973 RepID=A0A4Q7M3H4_9MICO|nr:hypothetical protein [Xylanibacterium ulmi]RZS61523.1 hypothetical protein EV386_1827 [Xylanibacterium ulmi]
MSRHPAPPHAPGRADDAGSTLVEVVLAALLLGLLAVVGTAAVVQGQRVTVANRARVVAAHLAARELDFARGRLAATPTAAVEMVDEGDVVNEHPVDETRAPGDRDAYVVDGMRYTVRRVARLRDLGATAPCGDAVIGARRLATDVAVTVTWQDMGSALPFTLRQIVTAHRDAATASQDALVAVTVTDHHDQGVEGVRATVAGAGAPGRSALTDSAGCALVAVAAPPSGEGINVTLTAETPHVDPSGNTAPSRALFGVAPSQITRTAFTYARAGTLLIHLSGAAEDSPITIMRPDGTLTIALPDAGSGGALITVADAYPGTWAAYPGAAGLPPGQEYPSVTVLPGETADLHVVIP